MPHVETSWRKHGDWKSRYSKLYSPAIHTSLTKEDQTYDTRRISFLSREDTPYTTMMFNMRADENKYKHSSTSAPLTHCSWLLPLYKSYPESKQSHLGGNETLLLEMVRARNRVLVDEAQDKTLELPREDASDDDASIEACMHGLSMRMTERSVSRSRVSRISTRRDMDIPSILAFATSNPMPPVHLEIPEFKKTNQPECKDIPRWSIRRSVCPVCSQKWRDRSSITNVKNSGLKRNVLVDSPSIIAPARLRTSIAIEYVPRPALAVVDEDASLGCGGLRNNSAAWQLTRARRLRSPKPRAPPPEATAPPTATAPLARQDLDFRVNRFLSDNVVKRRAFL